MKTDVHKATVAKTSAIVTTLPVSNPGAERFVRIDAHRGKKVAHSPLSKFNLPPGVVEDLSVKGVNHVGVKLTWGKVDNARQFDVMRALDKKFTNGVVGVRTRTDAPVFITNKLKSDTKYYFRVRPVNDDQTGSFSKTISQETREPATVFEAATYNVCSESCGGYRGRGQIAARQLNDAGVDVFGLQEAGGQRVGRVTSAIFSGGAQGFVRATGGQNARYVFYRPALFDQLGGGNFGLGHGRYATWASLRAKETGARFSFVSVHLENGHGNDAKRAAESRVLTSRMRAISGGLPVVYAGDFNSHPKRARDSPTAILRSINVTDSLLRSKSAPVNARINSGHTFSTTVLASGAHVDHIFVTADFEVRSWEQLVRISAGRYTKPMASDHNAISAVLALAANLPSLGDPTPSTPLDEP